MLPFGNILRKNGFHVSNSFSLKGKILPFPYGHSLCIFLIKDLIKEVRTMRGKG